MLLKKRSVAHVGRIDGRCVARNQLRRSQHEPPAKCVRREVLSEQLNRSEQRT